MRACGRPSRTACPGADCGVWDRISMNQAQHTIAIAGARGYSGQVLHALLMHHPCARPIAVEAREPDADAVAALRSCDVVALALPEEPARAWADALVAADVRVL